MSAAAQALADAHIEIAPEAEALASTLSLKSCAATNKPRPGVVTRCRRLRRLKRKTKNPSQRVRRAETRRTFGSFSGGAGAWRQLRSLSGSIPRAGLMDIWTRALHRRARRAKQLDVDRGLRRPAFRGRFRRRVLFPAHSAAPANYSERNRIIRRAAAAVGVSIPADASERRRRRAARRRTTRQRIRSPLCTQSYAPAATVTRDSVTSGLGPRVVRSRKAKFENHRGHGEGTA